MMNAIINNNNKQYENACLINNNDEIFFFLNLSIFNIIKKTKNQSACVRLLIKNNILFHRLQLSKNL